jgi:oligoribonuclease
MILSNRLIWIDLEMTGLDPERHVIIEMATIVTDNHLDCVAEGPNLAIYYPNNILKHMEEWSRTHHEASGLLDRVIRSPHDCRQAEQETLNFLSIHCSKGQSPMCGNSVWQDRRFLIKYMPMLEAFFHYRIIDVSSVKELVRRWYPSFPAFHKKKTHLALQDVEESIRELKYYRQKIFHDSKGLTSEDYRPSGL